jgi:outer membrane protein assembly factor BamB
MKKHLLIISILILLISSTLVPISIGNNTNKSKEQLTIENFNFDRYLYPEYYDCYNNDEISSFIEYQNYDVSANYEDIESEKNNLRTAIQILDGPMDSQWPMYCHDVRHTGRSPYSIADNPGTEKWRFDTEDDASGSPVIDYDGTIYIGGSSLFAVYPNGTLKWSYKTIFHSIFQAPAIDEDGIIYFSTAHGNPYLFAIYTSNGSLKWKFHVGDSVFSSPAIGDDGTIYFGCDNHHIYSLYSNGTLKWKYSTGGPVYSSPAIGEDGTIYCGSISDYIYALYPNGTLRWKFKTGAWVHGSPTIADDGTVYCGSDDGFLYALYPNNGELKWKLNIGSVWGSPAIDENGILYVGVFQGKFYAIFPEGTIKWVFNDCNEVWWTSASISSDGTIYFASNIDSMSLKGAEFISLTPDGTERWRIPIAHDYVFSTPAISKDGTIYIGSCNDGYHPGSWGYLHAIGPLDPDAPSAPDINGPKSGWPIIKYEYTFKSTSPLGNDVYYYVDWGDNTAKDWFGPFSSGEEVTLSHAWYLQGTYTIKARAKDTDNLWGPWGELEVTMPKNKATSNMLLLRILERFPLLQKIFLLID